MTIANLPSWPFWACEFYCIIMTFHNEYNFICFINFNIIFPQMLRVHNQVQNMQVKGQSYEDFCLR